LLDHPAQKDHGDRMKIAKLGPGHLLAITLTELVVLVMLLLSWRFGWLRVGELPQEIGGVLPLIVPWGGALGGVTISFVGLAQHWSKWSTNAKEGERWNTWYLVRGPVGAIMGSVGALALVLVLGSIGTTDTGEVDTSARGAAILMVLAFVLGYRQQTFAQLISRVVDVILGPGESPNRPSTGYSLSVSELAFESSANTPTEKSFTLTNVGSRLLQVPRSAFSLDGDNADAFRVTKFPGNVARDGQAIVTIEYRPTSQGTHAATLRITLDDSTQSVVLAGTAT
jgi:hypothetical protein